MVGLVRGVALATWTWAVFAVLAARMLAETGGHVSTAARIPSTFDGARRVHLVSTEKGGPVV